MFFSTAYSSAAQFLNDGSTTLTRASFVGASARTQCQIGPRHASTRPNAWPPAGRGGSGPRVGPSDRKSTRLNSSHGYISYAVFCLKKKKTHQHLNSEVQIRVS